jgi:glycosyltransferase involved in cell wall biosynthesis
LERSEIAIIIPAHNEAFSIEKVINTTKKFGTIILINDGSTDGTLEIAKKQNIIIINNSKKCGYDQSINFGFNYSVKKFKYIITFDADGQHTQNDLKKIISNFNKKTSVVCGVRNKVNRISEKIFLFLSKFFFNIKDPLSGLKGYNLSLLNRRSKFSKYDTLGTELIFFAKLNRLKINHVQIEINERKGKAKIGGLIKSNFLVLKAMIIVFILYLFNKL